MQFEHVLSKEGLYWGQAELSEFLPIDLQKNLLDLEADSWLSDLFWGELLAMKYARLRTKFVPAKRVKIWERIALDEMNHFSMISKWFATRKLLPSDPSPLFRRLSQKLNSLEAQPTEEGIAYASSMQLLLESLIHRLIEWRSPLIIDEELTAIIQQIQSDEIFHIHATAFETGQTDHEDHLLTYENLLFPLHLAKGLLSPEQMRKAKQAGRQVVRRQIFGGHQPLPEAKQVDL